jgi:hypothetical protein
MNPLHSATSMVASANRAHLTLLRWTVDYAYRTPDTN